MYESKPTWLQRVGPRIGIGAAAGAVGLLLGRAFSVPGSTEFWEVAGQPSATVLASAGVITAGYLAFHNGEKSRGLDAQHHRETMNGDRESNLQDRYTTAAKQLGDDNSAIREAGAFAIAALVDDWLRYGALIPEPGHAHSQAKTCVHLLCSYLRANRRRDDSVYGFEMEEVAVRNSIVGVLRERTGKWGEHEDAWVEEKKLPEDDRIALDLRGAKLVFADFYKANFRRASLSNADLRGAQLDAAQLQLAGLHSTNLTGAWIQGANFTGAQLIGTNFTSALASKAIFSGANIMNTVFVKAHLMFATFSPVEGEKPKYPFAETDFSGANLDGTDFTRCRLESGAIFDGAIFDDETKYTESTKWPEKFEPAKGKLVTSNRTIEPSNTATFPWEFE